MPNKIETACFRVAQEAITNIVRHARAKNVYIVLRKNDADLELMIRDDGIGFDVSAASDGFGLLGVRERLQLAGGTLEVDSVPGQGTTLTMVIPVRRVTDRRMTA